MPTFAPPPGGHALRALESERHLSLQPATTAEIWLQTHLDEKSSGTGHHPAQLNGPIAATELKLTENAIPSPHNQDTASASKNQTVPVLPDQSVGRDEALQGCAVARL